MYRSILRYGQLRYTPEPVMHGVPVHTGSRSGHTGLCRHNSPERSCSGTAPTGLYRQNIPERSCSRTAHNGLYRQNIPAKSCIRTGCTGPYRQSISERRCYRRQSRTRAFSESLDHCTVRHRLLYIITYPPYPPKCQNLNLAYCSSYLPCRR